MALWQPKVAEQTWEIGAFDPLQLQAQFADQFAFWHAQKYARVLQSCQLLLNTQKNSTPDVVYNLKAVAEVTSRDNEKPQRTARIVSEQFTVMKLELNEPIKSAYLFPQFN